MLYAIRLFQIIDLICIICSVFFKRKRDKSWNYLTFAGWIYYFCSVASFILSFGLYGIVENIEKDDGTFYVFLFAVCIGVVLAYIQKIWLIKYNDSTLIFRNSFGKTKKYNICELEVVEKSNMCEVRLDGKKIIEWPVLAINLREDVEFSRFMKKIKSNK